MDSAIGFPNTYPLDIDLSGEYIALSNDWTTGLKTGMGFRVLLVRKRVWKITFFGLKSGQDLKNRAAPPPPPPKKNSQEYPPPPPGQQVSPTIEFQVLPLSAVRAYSLHSNTWWRHYEQSFVLFKFLCFSWTNANFHSNALTSCLSYIMKV